MEISKEQLEGYSLYLKLIHERMLDRYFEEQAPYLCCKDGCSYCCEKGQYPMSKIEVQFIMLKMATLDKKTQEQILYDIQDTIKEKLSANLPREEFFYKCPFLISNSCSVYENRAIICRTHGLMFFMEDKDGKEKYKMPACAEIGLNYSKVYDKSTKKISEEAVNKMQTNTPPQAYNLSLKSLTKKEITQNLGFEFGEIKPLIEWFM